MSNLCIASINIKEDGSAQIEIDGYLRVPSGCDNPIIELFRPVRAKYREKCFFAITVTNEENSIRCNLYPSNTRGRPTDELLKIATELLKGDESSRGIIQDYTKILENFFSDENGLKAYLNYIKKAETANEDKKLTLYASCNTLIKDFVSKIGLTMPSRKRPANMKKDKQ